VDTIRSKASAALLHRLEAIPSVEAILKESIEEFGTWQKEMVVSPTIQKLKQALEQIRQEELGRYLKNADEKEFVLIDKITKEKGLGTVDPLIKSISDKIAPLNGGDPVKVATALINYKLGNRYPDPIADYRGYFLLNVEAEFSQFVAAVDERKLDRWEYAACAHALLSRVPNLVELNGGKWKTEDALNPELMPPGILVQLFNLYQLEASGADVDQYTNDQNEFTWKPAKATDTPVAEKETAEALAGK
jgi:hypothetical protein